jgi:hypothetical protein
MRLCSSSSTHRGRDVSLGGGSSRTPRKRAWRHEPRDARCRRRPSVSSRGWRTPASAGLSDSTTSPTRDAWTSSQATVCASRGRVPCAAVNSPRPGFPMVVSLGGGDLLVAGRFASGVSHLWHTYLAPARLARPNREVSPRVVGDDGTERLREESSRRQASRPDLDPQLEPPITPS